MRKNANVSSLEAIPAKLARKVDLAVYLRRAFDGEDVYAYMSIAGIWNIWDNGKRIELGVEE